MLDPLVNRGLEFDDVVEGSSSDARASDFGEEPLDEVELPRDCRRLFGLSYAAMAACSSMA